MLLVGVLSRVSAEGIRKGASCAPGTKVLATHVHENDTSGDLDAVRVHKVGHTQERVV